MLNRTLLLLSLLILSGCATEKAAHKTPSPIGGSCALDIGPNKIDYTGGTEQACLKQGGKWTPFEPLEGSQLIFHAGDADNYIIYQDVVTCPSHRYWFRGSCVAHRHPKPKPPCTVSHTNHVCRYK